jgi:hypothetical protein
MTDPRFLPGIPVDEVLTALRRAPGNELDSGKFVSPESSSSLAANAFGWFLKRSDLLPPLPGVPMGQPQEVELEAEMRFPWHGGRHPWLDVVLTTATTLVGVEAKRFEPFRPQKAVVFTESYSSRDWGSGMVAFDAMRRALVDGTEVFQTLNAAQLVKHAYGLRTQAIKRARGAVLVYLYAEPQVWASGKPVDPGRIMQHRAEIARFAAAIRGADVTFVPVPWSAMMSQWSADPRLAAHAAALTARFGPL